MTRDEKSLIITCLVPGAIAGAFYGLTVVNERRKRRGIKRWEKENLACIRASQKRIVDMLESGEYTHRQIFHAMREEKKFLDIVQNQPMY